MNDQQDFLQTIQELKELAAVKGGKISPEEIRGAFSDMELTEDHLGFILSNRQDLKDLGRALELYRELGDRQPEVPAHSRNAMIVSARILVEERKEKKKEKETQGRKSLFSFLRKK